MKITKKTFGTIEGTNNKIETPTWRIEYNRGSHVFKAGSGKVVVLEGSLYYYLDRYGKPIRFAQDDEARIQLKQVFDSVGEDGFNESVEGTYNLAVIDSEKDTVSVTGDAFNRVNLFYSIDGKYPVVSTESKDVLSSFDNVSYDPAVLSCLLILGYPPLKHTPYAGLFRLAVRERLLLQNGKIQLVKPKMKPVVSFEMNEANLDEYAEIFENAVLSRSSQSENWASVSGGWDSTIVLGVLRKYFDVSKVHGVVSQVKLSDGRVFNPYEIDKAMKIGKYYGVPVEVANIDLADASLNKLWGDTLNAGHSDFVYTQTFLFQAMVDMVRAKGSANAAIYFGSFADSLHNFGFAQGGSLLYLSNDFRNYSDKMMSYLYSPSFLEKVIANNFKNDFIYKLFKSDRAGGSEAEFADVSQMSKNDRIFEYLLSFVLSKTRLPFAPFASETIFSGHSRGYLKEWLWENYFKDVVEQINGNNMYSCLTWLYEHFHIQGFEKGAVTAGLRGSGIRPCFPFYDLRMVRFLEKMPESWGRGLEWRLTKYPLKHYGREKLKVPYDIIESGVHSYISETEEGKNVNMFSEIMNNSVLTPNTWKDMRNNADLDGLFDKEWFNIAVLNNTLEKAASESGPLLPIRLFLISTINEAATGISPQK
ncbi:MAG: hypothetical protein AABZ06_02895 [Bdellovibrionota bacterium]